MAVDLLAFPAMLRRLLPLVASLLPLAAVESIDHAILAAARSADAIYQRHVEELAQGLASPSLEERLVCLRKLGATLDPEVAGKLMPFLDPATRSISELTTACVSIANLGNAAAATPLLRPLTTHQDATVRLAASNALEQLGKLAAPEYMALGKDADETLRGTGITNLGTLKHAEAAELLAKALSGDSNPLNRRLSAIGLGQLGDRSQGPVLRDALSDADPEVRRHAAEALVRLNYTPAIPYLLLALEANVAGEHLARCLRLLSGQDFAFDPKADDLRRHEAIERGFQWWALNAKNHEN